MQRLLFLFLIASLSLSVTGLVSWLFYAVETADITATFEVDVKERVSTLETEIRGEFQTLYHWRDVYETFGEVNESRFSQLAKGTLDRHYGVTSVAWAPLVRKEEREAFEAQMRQRIPHFTIIILSQGAQMIHDPSLFLPAASRDWYFPITMIEPMSPENIVYGLDIATDDARLKRVTWARDTGNISATAAFPSFQGDPVPIFGAYVPVYHGKANTPEERQRKIRGFVLASFSVQKLVSHSMLVNNTDFAFTIRDGNPSGGIEMLYEHDLGGKKLMEDYRYQYQIENVVPGRTWLVDATPTGEYMAGRRSNVPWVSAVTGVACSILIVVYFHLLWRRTDVISDEVKSRTRDLNEANARLEVLSRTDGLTGLANRRWLNEFLEGEWKRAIREKLPITVILMDVDFFKPYNDNYGHLEGDSCLKKVADAIAATVQRPGDLVARYGGEEFAVVLPNTGDESQVIAEKIREAIEALEIPHHYSAVKPCVTISLGMATMIPEGDSKARELVNRADEALYQSKENGRNQVTVYNG